MKGLSITLVFVFALLGLISTPGLAQEAAMAGPNTDASVFKVGATDFALEAPEEIPSGWTTMEYTNEGEESHLLIVARLPDGKTHDDYAGEVVPVFNDLWYELREGDINQEEFLVGLEENLPAWYWNVEFMGGSGIIAPGLTSEISLDLNPGAYVMECYMKTEEGEFHTMEGMLRELTVTDTPSEGAPPEADIEVTLSNFEMAIDGELTPGLHTVAVHVAEQPEEGFGHNLHLARLNSEEDGDRAVRWINFMEVEGLMPPAPVEFAGGMHILPAGQTGYFTVDLEPGRYLFLSEYTGHKGVLQEATVKP